MNKRTAHTLIGFVLIIPILAWTVTGVIFFLKPGYKEAYQQLSVKTYPLEKEFSIPPSQTWQEVRLIKSILGYHLLVKSSDKNKHLDPLTLQDKPFPSALQYESLLNDAVSKNKARYGDIVSVNGPYAKTSHGIDIKLDWHNLTLSQKGSDTRLINLLYKIHYLQWSGFKGLNEIMGIIGLLLLSTLAVLGIKIYTEHKIKEPEDKRKSE